jgi:hypothetical protein
MALMSEARRRRQLGLPPRLLGERQVGLKIAGGRYIIDDDTIDAALTVCADFNRSDRAAVEGHRASQAAIDAWADRIVHDPDLNAAFHLLADNGGPLDPDDAHADPGPAMRAWERDDRDAIRAILTQQATKVFPHLCPMCQQIAGSPHRH